MVLRCRAQLTVYHPWGPQDQRSLSRWCPVGWLSRVSRTVLTCRVFVFEFCICMLLCILCFVFVCRARGLVFCILYSCAAFVGLYFVFGAHVSGAVTWRLCGTGVAAAVRGGSGGFLFVLSMLVAWFWSSVLRVVSCCCALCSFLGAGGSVWRPGPS